jgi:hypothetical protein
MTRPWPAATSAPAARSPHAGCSGLRAVHGTGDAQIVSLNVASNPLSQKGQLWPVAEWYHEMSEEP